ncbi:hypothetical protein Ancab_005146 [Ancistrocladus abbreviatus]
MAPRSGHDKLKCELLMLISADLSGKLTPSKEMSCRQPVGSFWKDDGSILDSGLGSLGMEGKADVLRLGTKKAHKAGSGRVGRMGRAEGFFEAQSTGGVQNSLRHEGPEVEGISIEDSSIQNRNRIICQLTNRVSATEVWEVSKKLGIMYNGLEEEVIEQLRNLKERDKKAKEQTM